MSILSTEILNAAERGGLISPREFLHLGTRAAVDQTFYRLIREDKLSRVCRGGYMAPIVTGMLQSTRRTSWGVIELRPENRTEYVTRNPGPEAAMAAIAQRDKVVITTDGAAAARSLGLTTEPPQRLRVFVTSGRAYAGLGTVMKPIRIKPGPKWQFVLGDSQAGTVVRALAWLGKDSVDSVLAQLRPKLTSEDRTALLAARGRLPCWMAKALSISLAA